MSTKITPEALIEMGFVDNSSPDDMIFHDYMFRDNDFKVNVYGDKNYVDIFIDGNWITATNATTIEDIKDLIRLFK
jgi:hypothetical protein